jgi:hypothetical protein
MRNINLDIYIVTKPITVNNQAICQIGDILIVDEGAYDCASGYNLTQGWGFQPFFNYESVKEVDKTQLSLTQYINLIYGTREEQQAFINQFRESIEAVKPVIKEPEPINQTEPHCSPNKDGVYQCSTCLQDCPLSNDAD